jgi:hypothetical protein
LFILYSFTELSNFSLFRVICGFEIYAKMKCADSIFQCFSSRICPLILSDLLLVYLLEGHIDSYLLFSSHTVLPFI